MVDNGAYQQTTIGSTGDGHFVGAGVVFGNEVLGGGDAVVEYVLFVHLSTGDVPVFTIFAAAAQIHHRVDTTSFQERNALRRETGRQADVETAVTIQIHRIFAIALQAFFVSEEHGNARAVLAFEKYLFASIFIRIEIELRAHVQFRLIFGQIVFENA